MVLFEVLAVKLRHDLGNLLLPDQEGEVGLGPTVADHLDAGLDLRDGLEDLPDQADVAPEASPYAGWTATSALRRVECVPAVAEATTWRDAGSNLHLAGSRSLESCV